MNNRDDIRKFEALVAAAETQNGLRQGSVKLFPILETCAGVANAMDILSSSERFSGCMYGAADYAADLGVLEKDAAVRSGYAPLSSYTVHC